MKKFLVIALIVLIAQAKIGGVMSLSFLLALIAKLAFVVKLFGLRSTVKTTIVCEVLSVATMAVVQGVFSTVNFKILGLYAITSVFMIIVVTLVDAMYVFVTEEEK